MRGVKFVHTFCQRISILSCVFNCRTRVYQREEKALNNMLTASREKWFQLSYEVSITLADTLSVPWWKYIITFLDLLAKVIPCLPSCWMSSFCLPCFSAGRPSPRHSAHPLHTVSGPVGRVAIDAPSPADLLGSRTESQFDTHQTVSPWEENAAKVICITASIQESHLCFCMVV